MLYHTMEYISEYDYAEVKTFTMEELQKYLETARKLVPALGFDGRALHLHTVGSLKAFCRSYGVSIDGLSTKADILLAIDNERVSRASAIA